jgi:hypothetical protein
LVKKGYAGKEPPGETRIRPSQESENKLKIIPQIFENLLPFGNKFEKESGELFSIYSHSRGVFLGLFFHEYKIKNTKKDYIIALNRFSFIFNN